MTSWKEQKKFYPVFFWGGDYEQLKFLIDTGQVSNSEIRFFAGYSGWEADQLDNELGEKSWMLTAPNAELTFFGEPTKLWSEVLRSMGSEFAILANFPEDPSLN